MVHVPYQGFAVKGKRAWQGVCTGLGILLPGLGMLAAGQDHQLAWATVICGLPITVLFALLAVLRLPKVWFDDGGLRARFLGFPATPWPEIERVRFVRVEGLALLVVERTDEARRRRPGGRRLRELARRAKAKDLAVPIDLLSASPEKIYAVVELAHRCALQR